MANELIEARELGSEKFLESLKYRTMSYALAAKDGYRAGFDDATQSLTGWVAISSADDLPKDEGQYLWRFRRPDFGGYETQYFHHAKFASKTEYWIKTYSHWQKITVPAPEAKV